MSGYGINIYLANSVAFSSKRLNATDCLPVNQPDCHLTFKNLNRPTFPNETATHSVFAFLLPLQHFRFLWSMLVLSFDVNRILLNVS